MNIVVLIVKFIFLLLAIVYGFSNTVKAINNMRISNAQMGLMGIGIAGFICLQWLM